MYDDIKRIVKEQEGQVVEVFSCENRTVIIGEIDSYCDDGFWIRRSSLVFVNYGNVNSITEGNAD